MTILLPVFKDLVIKLPRPFHYNEDLQFSLSLAALLDTKFTGTTRIKEASAFERRLQKKVTVVNNKSK